MGTAVWVLTKMVPYSASAADAIILRMILHTMSKMPLVVGTKYSGVSVSVGPSVRKLTALARLLDQLKVRRLQNIWPIVSHLLCIGFLLVDLRLSISRA